MTFHVKTLRVANADSSKSFFGAVDTGNIGSLRPEYKRQNTSIDFCSWQVQFLTASLARTIPEEAKFSLVPCTCRKIRSVGNTARIPLLHEIREAGMVMSRDGFVTFNDYDSLCTFADFEMTYLDQIGPLLI